MFDGEGGFICRRKLLAGGLVGGAALVGSGLPWPRLAMAASTDPKPIPGGAFGPQWHFFLNSHTEQGNLASPIYEQSTVTDFDGVIASNHVQGTGTGTDTRTGIGQPLAFDADMRIMHGTYVAVDGKQYEGTFGFI
jgi:hypothetical protein